jgi:hypothetical protein
MSNLQARIVHREDEARFELSKSSLDQLCRCPMKYSLYHSDRKNQIPVPIPMLVGNVVHTCPKYFWDPKTKGPWDPDKFANFMAGGILANYFRAGKGEEGIPVKVGRAKTELLKPNPAYRHQPIQIADLANDFRRAKWMVRRCSSHFAKRFTGKPKPFFEFPFHCEIPPTELNGEKIPRAVVNGRFDMLFRRHPKTGRFYIGEIKTSKRHPKRTGFEPPLYIAAWGNEVAKRPALAESLGVTPEEVERLRADPLYAFEIAAMIYFYFYNPDPEDSGQESEEGELEERSPQVVFEEREREWWPQVVSTIRDREKVVLHMLAGGDIPLYQSHCDFCEAEGVCRRYLFEEHGITISSPHDRPASIPGTSLPDLAEDTHPRPSEQVWLRGVPRKK